MSNVRRLRQKNFSRPLVPSAEKLQASNSSQLEAIRGGLLTYEWFMMEKSTFIELFVMQNFQPIAAVNFGNKPFNRSICNKSS